MDLQQGGTGTASEFRDGLLTHLLLAGDLNLGHSHEESSHDAALTGLKAEYRLVAQNEDRVDDPLTLAPIPSGSADRIRVDAQPSTDEGPPRILEMMSLLDGFTCGPPCRAILDRTHRRTVRATSHRTLNLGDRSDADTEAQAQPFRQKEVCAQGESESVDKSRRDRLQLVTDRGVRTLRQRQTFGGLLQSLMDDTLSTHAIRELTRADDVCDECVGSIHGFTIVLVMTQVQGIPRSESRLLAPTLQSALYSCQHKLSPGARPTCQEASHRRRGSTGRTATRT